MKSGRTGAIVLTVLCALGGAISLSNVPGDAPLAMAPVRIDINSASEAELRALPSIGPARARAIVEERASAGPFGSASDLQRVRGIGPRTVAEIEPWVTALQPLGPAPAEAPPEG